MKTRVQQDRHYFCTAAKCVAMAPKKLAAGRNAGKCIPRATWWLRTRNSAGKRVSIAFKSEIEAREAMRKLEAAKVLGVHYSPRAGATPPAPLFTAVAEEALKLYRSLMKPRPKTMSNHQMFLKAHLTPFFGAKPVTPASFTVLEIQRFITHARTTLADSTLKASLPTLRLALDHAVKLGLLTVNPMRSGERLWRAAASETVEAFTASELRSILKAARVIDLHVAIMIQVMAQGGLRPGEALALRRQDVDAATGMVHVSGSQGRFGRGPTKNPYSVRKVSVLHPVTEDRPVWRPVDAGIGTRRVLDGLALLSALAPDAESRLWPMSESRMDRAWKKVLKTAGVPYRKPHALRHSFASILLSRGANLLAVQKAGGWRSAQVLLTTYAHYMADQDTAGASGVQAEDLTAQHPDVVGLTG